MSRSVLFHTVMFLVSLVGLPAYGSVGFTISGWEYTCESERVCDVRRDCIETDPLEIGLLEKPLIYAGGDFPDWVALDRAGLQNLNVTGFPEFDQETKENEVVRGRFEPFSDPVTFWRYASAKQRAVGVWFLKQTSTETAYARYVKRIEHPDKPFGQRVQRRVWYFSCTLIREISFEEYQYELSERSEAN